MHSADWIEVLLPTRAPSSAFAGSPPTPEEYGVRAAEPAPTIPGLVAAVRLASEYGSNGCTVLISPAAFGDIRRQGWDRGLPDFRSIGGLHVVVSDGVFRRMIFVLDDGFTLLEHKLGADVARLESDLAAAGARYESERLARDRLAARWWVRAGMAIVESWRRVAAALSPRQWKE